MDKDFDTLIDLTRWATSRIGEYHFLPGVAGNAATERYRERIYAYELYHQMRVEWPAWGYVLGGEVDKRGHPLIRDGLLQNVKPDLVVHEPRTMDRNLAVFELKAAIADDRAIALDLRKLTAFCRSADYHGGIFLVFGTHPEELANSVERVASGDHEIDLERVTVLCHPECHAPAELCRGTRTSAGP